MLSDHSGIKLETNSKYLWIGGLSINVCFIFICFQIIFNMVVLLSSLEKSFKQRKNLDFPTVVGNPKNVWRLNNITHGSKKVSQEKFLNILN